MRDATRGRVLSALLRERPASRKQLAEATGASAATVSRTVDQLLADGLVHEGSELVAERRGRREVLLDVEPGIGACLGIDLGGSRTRVVVVDATSAPIAVADVATRTDLDARALGAWIASLARDVASDAWGRVRAAAIGLPGAVAHPGRAVSNAPNLPQIEEHAFFDAVERAFDVPVACDNDANFALLGEQVFGAAVDADSAAMVTIGAGLGVGLSIDRTLVRGRRGIVGEFGQLPAGPGGELLESVVTGPGILARAAAVGAPLEAPADLFSAGTPASLAPVRAEFDHALRVLLAAVAVSCDPDVIVLGGGIAKSLRDELPRLQEALDRTLPEAPRLVGAALGDMSGAAGAAAAALHMLYEQLGVDRRDLAGLPAPGALTAASLAATT